jgi:hypothetical protein
MVCGSEEIKKTIEDALHIKVTNTKILFLSKLCVRCVPDAGLLQSRKLFSGPVRMPPHHRALTLLWC